MTMALLGRQLSALPGSIAFLHSISEFRQIILDCSSLASCSGAQGGAGHSHYPRYKSSWKAWEDGWAGSQPCEPAASSADHYLPNTKAGNVEMFSLRKAAFPPAFQEAGFLLPPSLIKQSGLCRETSQRQTAGTDL